MESAILFSTKQIEHGPGHASQLVEIRDRGRIDVYATDTSIFRDEISDTRFTPVITSGGSAEATIHVKMPNLADVNWTIHTCVPQVPEKCRVDG